MDGDVIVVWGMRVRARVRIRVLARVRVRVRVLVQVSTPELMEVMTINAIAPFTLNRCLSCSTSTITSTVPARVISNSTSPIACSNGTM